MFLTQIFTDKYNALVGAVVAILSAIFGIYWYVFFAYLLLNIVDWLTGWYKSRLEKKESSRAGFQGIIKKLGYWAVILVAFVVSGVFVNIGDDLLGINLSFLYLIGWWTIAMLIINEIRSILENLVECGYNVPVVLIKGLEVTEKLIAAQAKMEEKKDE